MTVEQVMSKPPVTCRPSDDLRSVARAMASNHCGFVPVIDAQGNLCGVLTDRDICLAVATLERPADRIPVKDMMTHPVRSCLPDMHVKSALATMAKFRVRRLPVIDKHGRLQAIVSIDDIVQAPRERGAASAEEIVAALKEICLPHVEETLVP
jgi:CBS domain-containing protein